MYILRLLVLFFSICFVISQPQNWTPNDFNTKKDSFSFVLAHFLNPKCPYCQALVPKFEAASKELETTFPNVAFVNADCIAYPVFLNKFNITGYPTLMWFDTKSNPLSSPGELYQMKHSKEDIVNFVKSKAGLCFYNYYLHLLFFLLF
ncbi:Protein disulfide-isomerase A3 [Coelomomyces lativittatus]|nr:Protein disulfide-isomerase A3 [Coelomomyces lativittatus]